MKVKKEDLEALNTLIRIAMREGASVWMDDGGEWHLEPWYQKARNLQERLEQALDG